MPDRRLKSSETERKASVEPQVTFPPTPGSRERNEDIFQQEKEVIKNVDIL